MSYRNLPMHLGTDYEKQLSQEQLSQQEPCQEQPSQQELSQQELSQQEQEQGMNIPRIFNILRTHNQLQ